MIIIRPITVIKPIKQTTTTRTAIINRQTMCHEHVWAVFRLVALVVVQVNKMQTTRQAAWWRGKGHAVGCLIIIVRVICVFSMMLLQPFDVFEI